MPVLVVHSWRFSGSEIDFNRNLISLEIVATISVNLFKFYDNFYLLLRFHGSILMPGGIISDEGYEY